MSKNEIIKPIIPNVLDYNLARLALFYAANLHFQIIINQFKNKHL